MYSRRLNLAVIVFDASVHNVVHRDVMDQYHCKEMTAVFAQPKSAKSGVVGQQSQQQR